MNKKCFYTLDVISASDLLLREIEQQEKVQREREQQGKSGLNRIKKIIIILIPGTNPGQNSVWIPSLLVLIPLRIILFLLIFYDYP